MYTPTSISFPCRSDKINSAKCTLVFPCWAASFFLQQACTSFLSHTYSSAISTHTYTVARASATHARTNDPMLLSKQGFFSSCLCWILLSVIILYFFTSLPVSSQKLKKKHMCVCWLIARSAVIARSLSAVDCTKCSEYFVQLFETWTWLVCMLACVRRCVTSQHYYPFPIFPVDILRHSFLVLYKISDRQNSSPTDTQSYHRCWNDSTKWHGQSKRF